MDSDMGREAGEIMDQNDVYPDIIETLFSLPEVGRPLIRNAKATLAKIERMLYAAPSFASTFQYTLYLTKSMSHISEHRHGLLIIS